MGQTLRVGRIGGCTCVGSRFCVVVDYCRHVGGNGGPDSSGVNEADAGTDVVSGDDYVSVSDNPGVGVNDDTHVAPDAGAICPVDPANFVASNVNAGSNDVLLA